MGDILDLQHHREPLTVFVSINRPGANRDADVIGIAPGFGAEVDMVPRMMGESLESLRERAVIACPDCHFFVMRYASTPPSLL